MRPVPLRLAVVGCGAVTERYHLPAIAASSDVAVAAFVDPVVDRARSFASRWSGGRALSDYREVADLADLAIVAAPNHWHEPIAVDLLRRGIHVLVEKPMARTRAECDRMIDAAAEGGAVLAVGQDFRHFPIARYAHDFLAAGLLGDIRSVDVRQSAGTRWPSVSPDALAADSGGGVLMSFGVHTLDLLLWWLGNLQPLAYRDDACGGVEAECVIELTLDNDAPAHVEMSRSRSMRDTTIVTGDRGTIEIGIHEPALIRLTVGSDCRELSGVVEDVEFERAPLRAVFTRQLRDFVDAVNGGRQPFVGGSDGRRVVSLIESCYAIREPLRQPWDYPEAYAINKPSLVVSPSTPLALSLSKGELAQDVLVEPRASAVLNRWTQGNVESSRDVVALASLRERN